METKVESRVEEELRATEGKAVVIFSGGIDSTVLVYDVKGLGYEACPITFYYGQKHAKELEMAHKTCERLGLKYKLVDVESLGKIAPSALTREEEIPKAQYDEESMKQTVVPNRNMVFLSLATAYAIGIGASWVFFGAHGGDHALYPDCRPTFVKAMEQAISLCDYSIVSLKTPYLYYTKADILRLGVELEVDYSLTWSCYEGGKLACGKCGTCRERLEAFREVNLEDPIEYKEV